MFDYSCVLCPDCVLQSGLSLNLIKHIVINVKIYFIEFFTFYSKKTVDMDRGLWYYS